MSTQAVSYTATSTPWTGSIDVTNADLLSDTSIKDFTVFYNGTEQGSTELANWIKTSQSVVTYSGSSISSGDVILVKRKTPNSVLRTVATNEVISASLWNQEFDRVIRWREEKDAFGYPVVGSGLISDEAYGSGWNGVTTEAPSKNSVYDKIESVVTGTVSDTAYGSGWNGVTSVAPSKNAVYDEINLIEAGTISLSGTKTVTGTWDFTGATTTCAANTHTSNANSVVNYTTWASYLNGVMGGRLSTTSGSPLGDTGVASGTLYYVPCPGVPQVVTLWDGTLWRVYAFSTEISLALSSLSASTMYDIFVYWTGSALALDAQAWTSDSSRGSNKLDYQNGIPVKYGSKTYRWVGCIRTDASKQITVALWTANHTDTLCLVWNAYNQIQATLGHVSSSGDFNMTSGTWYSFGTTAPVTAGYFSFVNDDPNSDVRQGVWRNFLSFTQTRNYISSDADTTWSTVVELSLYDQAAGTSIRDMSCFLTNNNETTQDGVYTQTYVDSTRSGMQVLLFRHRISATSLSGSGLLTCRDSYSAATIVGYKM